MSVRMHVETVAIEKNSENEKLASYIAMLEYALKGFNRYVNDTELAGDAYTCHKEYVECAEIPTIQGLIELFERMISANSKYIEIVTSYFTGMINEELWENELRLLNEQYNLLIDHVESLEHFNYIQGNYYPITPAGKYYDNNPYVINSLRDEISVLYTMIELYKDKLRDIEEMNTKLFGIYYDVDNLKTVVAAAVNELKNGAISADGSYDISLIDYSVFTDLQNSLIALGVTDHIKGELGEEYLQAYISGMLSDLEKQNMLTDAVNIAADYAPSFVGEVGHIEFMVYPGFSVYFDNTITTDIGQDVPVSCEVSMEEDAEYLASNSISIGDFSVGFGQSSIGLQFEEEIDEFSTAYGEIYWEFPVTSLEYGVNTTIQESNVDNKSDVGVEVLTTVAVGANMEPIGGSWQPDTVTEEAYVEATEPDWELELEMYEHGILPSYVTDNLNGTDLDILYVFPIMESAPVIIMP